MVLPTKSGNVRIMPGVQEIESSKWKEIEAQVKDKLEEGEIENMDERMEDEFEEGLGAFSITEAKKLVKETADESLLNEWLAGEKRKGVVDAINKQKDYIVNSVNESEED